MFCVFVEKQANNESQRMLIATSNASPHNNHESKEGIVHANNSNNNNEQTGVSMIQTVDYWVNRLYDMRPHTVMTWGKASHINDTTPKKPVNLKHP